MFFATRFLKVYYGIVIGVFMDEGKKLSVLQCRKILEEGGGKYSDEQVRLIRDVLYTLGELDYLIFKQIQNQDKSDLDQYDSEKAA